MEFQLFDPPTSGSRIGLDEDGLRVPDDPIVCIVPGDGIGPEVWEAARPVLDAAVKAAYGGQRALCWFELQAGAAAERRFGDLLPRETVDALRHFRVGLRGPLSTPGTGTPRSPHLELRRQLDLYAGLRPVRWLEGVPCPVKHPEKLDLVLFRESTEDLHSGLEWPADSETARAIVELLAGRGEGPVPEGSGLGLKAVSAQASKRLVRRALRFALDRGRSSVTLVHEGSVMRHTEGAFRDWGYELAQEEFAGSTITETELWEKYEGSRPDNKVIIKDRLAESMFQQLMLKPDEHSVLATTNLNGHFLASALSAQAGGSGLAPAASLGEEVALFETAHGSAEKLAGKNSANPTALILAGGLLLEHLGWTEASRLVVQAVQATVQQKKVTADLERRLSGATLLGCAEFGDAVAENLDAES